jgi:hypothetical protein
MTLKIAGRSLLENLGLNLYKFKPKTVIKDEIRKMIGRTKFDNEKRKAIKTPKAVPEHPPNAKSKVVFISKFSICEAAPKSEENGMIKRFMAKASIREKPITFNKGILIEPPPIPNIPLIKPVTKPMIIANNNINQ